MTQRLLVSVLASAALCLPALAQDKPQRTAPKPTDEIRQLKKRVAELEDRIASLERMAVRFAGAPKVETDHGYYAGTRQLDDDERVSGVDWLRKVPGIIYAKTRTLPYFIDGTSTTEILSRVAKRRLHPADPLPYRCGFRFGDEILSVNGVTAGELPTWQRLRYQMQTAPGIAVLIKRKGEHLLLPFRIAPPVHRTEPPQPPADVANEFSIVMVSVATDDASRSTVILHSPNGRSVTLGIGDEFEGYRVLSIAIRGQGERRVAEVALRSREGQETIRLSRKTN